MYIDGLLTRYGCSENEKPGPNLLGKVCDEAAKALAGVEREVVKSGLVTRAARRLGVETKQLEKLILASSKGKISAVESKPMDTKPSVTSGPAAERRPGSMRGLESLPRIDLDILRSVMVEKEVLLVQLLKTPEMCEGLQPETLRFATVFSELLRESPDDEEHQRLSTKELLQSLGPAWLAASLFD